MSCVCERERGGWGGKGERERERSDVCIFETTLETVTTCCRQRFRGRRGCWHKTGRVEVIGVDVMKQVGVDVCE